jgi:tyrosinase
MAASRNVELLGTFDQRVNLVGTEALARVTLDDTVKRKVAASLTNASETAPPDRIFLNLEHVRGLNDSVVCNVYVNLPVGVDPAMHPECKAGSIALFGVRKATMKDGKHSGNGLTFVLEITNIIDRLHLAGTLDAGHLDVRLVARNPVSREARISIDRISVFRQDG